MYNNIFQQATNPANNSYGMTNNGMMGGFGGFPQNNGMGFNNIAPAKTSTTTPEEMAIIKAQKKNNFTVTPEELAKFGWDLREGQNLAIEIVDPASERVRIKYTGEEFNIVVQPVEVLNGYLEGLRNFGYTTALMNTTDSQDVLKELLTAIGVVNKLLPIAYENGKKNYNTICNQMQNMMSSQGYQGTWGGQQMFNGAIGAVPNYIINDGNNMMMNNGMVNNAYGMNPQMLQAAAQMGAQQMQQQMLQAANNMNNSFGNAGMGIPTMPNGGTMMGNSFGMNPFTQNGAPQQMPTNPMPGATPALNSIPAPGTPVSQNTANPAMGGNTNTTTTNTVKI